MRPALFALLVLLVPEAHAVERVVRLQIDTRLVEILGPPRVPMTTFRNATADLFGPSTDQLLDENTFTVFTVSEVEAALSDSAKRVTDAIHLSVDEKLLAADTKLRADVLKAVNDIPQRVLSDVAAQGLQERILERLREEIDQLRKDLQSQIDALREEP